MLLPNCLVDKSDDSTLVKLACRTADEAVVTRQDSLGNNALHMAVICENEYAL